MASSMLRFGVLAAALSCAFAASATTVSISSSDFHMSGIGSNPAGEFNYDLLDFEGVSTFNFDVPNVMVELGRMTFSVGTTCSDLCAEYSVSGFTSPFNVTVEGVTKQVSFGYNWRTYLPSQDAEESVDEISFSPIAPVIFDLANGAKVQLDFETPWTFEKVLMDQQFGQTVAANLTYTPAAVPEPGSIGLVLAGVGIVGLVARRKARRA